MRQCARVVLDLPLGLINIPVFVSFNSYPYQDFPSVTCSDICQVMDGATVCSCSAGFTLGSDQHTCIGKP